MTSLPGSQTTVSTSVNQFNDLAPLLTTYTPPTECSTYWVYALQTTGTVWRDREKNSRYQSHCQPFSGVNTLYRPGVCPSGQEFKSLDVTVEAASVGGRSWWVGRCCSS
ncbi:uncharacterized protein GGS22DRAFT_114527 [Annulohypoxylon maeteangense]|uniref:uncharacterized protein n=1 Tax=Annulohypoxylon maeteangense TaxID=1927788 RepID=UPI002007453B|nr:uncharacterized protein GGS22DRAFT_114527 [Annulohypoxylon maeteangense]KAI0886515.1 hypothetical protein GGS22DRAFT_114527 [Annulohypoxylon maeteangense]